MKVLVFAPFACSEGHHETDVEVVTDNLAQGNEVHVIQCQAELAICDPNPTHSRKTCLVCHSTSTRSLRLAGLSPENLHSLSILNPTKPEAFSIFTNIKSLMDYTWEGLPVGHAVASSAILLLRETHPDMAKYRYFVNQSLAQWLDVFKSISKYIDQLNPDIFYVFNARAGVVSAAFHAAQRKHLRTLVTERDIYDEYTVYENTISIDLEYSKKSIVEFTARMKKDPQGLELADSWFRSRTIRKKEIFGDYLEHQVPNYLPVGFDARKRNIGVFVSSEDEVFIADGWQNPVYENQMDALRKIFSTITDESFHFYLRIHPNLMNIDNYQNRELAKLAYKNVTKLEATDPVDSYTLLNACEKTVSFGSTVGIESVFWGKPSILVGRTYAENLGAMYTPKSHDEVIQLIRAKLEPLPKERALPYGYWKQKFGHRFQYVVPRKGTVVASGGLFGKALGPSRPVKIIVGVSNRLFKIRLLLKKYLGWQLRNPLDRVFSSRI